MKTIYRNIAGFMIADYFFTGNIPYGSQFYADEKISDAKLVADCINAAVWLNILKNKNEIVKKSLEKAAKLLGMKDLSPILKADAHGFIEYAKRSAITGVNGCLNCSEAEQDGLVRKNLIG